MELLSYGEFRICVAPLLFDHVQADGDIFVQVVEDLIFVSVQRSFPFVSLELDIRGDLLHFCIWFDFEISLSRSVIHTERALVQRPS